MNRLEVVPFPLFVVWTKCGSLFLISIRDGLIWIQVAQQDSVFILGFWMSSIVDSIMFIRCWVRDLPSKDRLSLLFVCSMRFLRRSLTKMWWIQKEAVYFHTSDNNQSGLCGKQTFNISANLILQSKKSTLIAHIM